MLATSTPTCTPWFVLPKFAMTARTDRGATWIVEAEEPPPMKVVRTRSGCVTIDRYVDERAMSPKARVWARPISVSQNRMDASRTTVPKQPWEKPEPNNDIDVDSEGDDGANGDDSDQTQNDDLAGETQNQCSQAGLRATMVPQPKARPSPWNLANANHPNPGQPVRRPRAFLLTEGESTDTSSAPAHKKKYGEATRTSRASAPYALPARPMWADQTAEEETRNLRAQLDERDAKIMEMQNSMLQMQAMMQNMMAALASNGTIPSETASTMLASIGIVQPQQQQQQQPTDQRQLVQEQSQQDPNMQGSGDNN